MTRTLPILLTALLALSACKGSDRIFDRHETPEVRLYWSDQEMAAYTANAERMSLQIRTDGPVPPETMAACVTPHVNTLRDLALQEDRRRAATNPDPDEPPRFQDVMRAAEVELEERIWECGRVRGYRHFELAAGSLAGFHAQSARLQGHEFVRRVTRDRDDNRNYARALGQTRDDTAWADRLTIRAVMSPRTRTIIGDPSREWPPLPAAPRAP